MQQAMTGQNVSREQAVAIAELIEERMEAEYARLIAAPKPDPRINVYRSAAALRRTARRLREGLFRPSWMTESPEELARHYDYAAEYDDMVRDVRRLAKAHKKVQQHIASDLFAEVREVFHHMKGWLRDPDLDPVTAENILALHRAFRRDLGRSKA
jgi:hypothetical protein